jgi:glycosyltransferase involved in cell wall biosynthesis
MRVLHMVNDVTDRGNGIVNTAVDLAMEQARQGLEVAVASAGGAYQSLLEAAGVTHLMLDQSRRPAQMLGAIRLLHRQLSGFRPDVVHAHMRTGLVLAWLLKPFHRYGLIGHVHNVHDRESVVMGLADRVIAVSKSVAASMAKRGVPSRKIRVSLNRTLGSKRVPPLEAIAPAVLARPAIVTVCGMSRRKGVDALIRAFAKIEGDIPGAHLYLVGDGPDRKDFELLAKQSHCPGRIHFEGYQAQPQAYMVSADVFVLASRRESFGLVLIEAREAGCAVVATDVDGVAEALDGGRAGLLVPQNDDTALAGALRRVLSDPAEQAKWRDRAKSGIDEFRIEQMTAEINAIYEELLPVKHARTASRASGATAVTPQVRTISPQPADDRESQAARW